MCLAGNGGRICGRRFWKNVVPRAEICESANIRTDGVVSYLAARPDDDHDHPMGRIGSGWGEAARLVCQKRQPNMASPGILEATLSNQRSVDSTRRADGPEAGYRLRFPRWRRFY